MAFPSVHEGFGVPGAGGDGPRGARCWPPTPGRLPEVAGDAECWSPRPTPTPGPTPSTIWSTTRTAAVLPARVGRARDFRWPDAAAVPSPPSTGYGPAPVTAREEIG